MTTAAKSPFGKAFTRGQAEGPGGSGLGKALGRQFASKAAAIRWLNALISGHADAPYRVEIEWRARPWPKLRHTRGYSK